MSTPINTISGIAPVPIKSKLVCAAVGDSLMWGQGLKLEQKFCYLAARELAKHAGKTFTRPEIRARSGAQIAFEAADFDGARAVRRAFTKLFPELFDGLKGVNIFVAGNDRVADELYHDIPATFPLIPTQLEMLGEGPRRDIDLLFLNGGANDVDFKQVLDPDGPNLHTIHGYIRERVYKPLRDLLAQARLKCPNALIVVPSYFPMMTTTGTNRNALTEFIDWIGGVRDKYYPVGVAASAGVSIATASIFTLPAGILLTKYFVGEGLNDAANEMRRRVETTFPLCQFWMARAVADAGQMNGVRGPGIVFVNARFEDVNSIYASNSFVYGDFDPPKDPLADARMQLDPRGSLENSLRELHRLLRLAALPTIEPSTAALYLKNAEIFRQSLVAELRGPIDLVEALSHDDVLISKPKTAELFQLLNAELLRLKVVRIASIMHPNAEGAERYAKRIVKDVLMYQYERFESSYEALVTSLVVSMGDPLPTAEEALRAFGLDPDAPRGEIMQFIRPDIITVTIHGAKAPEGQTGTSLTLRHFSGNSPVKAVALTILHLPGEQTTILTGDAGGRFNLGYYKRCLLKDASWAVGRTVRMYVNGRRVLDTEVTTAAGKDLELPYPAPIPGRPDQPPIDPELVT